MTTSRIVKKNDNWFFEINGEVFPACAYITYFEEHNDYKLFADLGYRLFSVTVSFADQPINPISEFRPVPTGIFDKKGEADFSVVDASIRQILENCPNAYIFPRIQVYMPQWWIDENPSEVIPVMHGKYREALYSEKFRQTAAQMLCQTIAHFNNAPFADRIFGYHISGGATQEWFHLDLHGGYHPNALPYFREFLEKKYPHMPALTELPDLNLMQTEGQIEDDTVVKYLEFSSESVAETVEHFCAVAKKAVDRKQFVGAFYGYTAEVCDQLHGTHAINKLLDSENIDFFSSPNSYAFARSLGEEWGDMMPANSVWLHDKLYFVENDIRTFLSKIPGESRKDCDPHKIYTGAVWYGPPTEDLSVAAVRKSFARRLTQKQGFWWFDMFGHWFTSEKLVREMKTSLEVCTALGEKKTADLDAEVAVFVDETMYTKLGAKAPAVGCISAMRGALAKSGCPYHAYLIEDFAKLTQGNFAYKAVVLATPLETGLVADAADYCKKNNVPCLRFRENQFQFSADAYRSFFKNSGVWCYLETEDVFYIGNGYFAIHASREGEKTVRFPEKRHIVALNDHNKTIFTDTLQVPMRQFETQLFQLV